MSKAKITVTIDEALITELDRISAGLKENRSRLIEKALKFWNQWQLEQELIEGYCVMAKEDVKTAEDNLFAGLEPLT